MEVFRPKVIEKKDSMIATSVMLNLMVKWSQIKARKQIKAVA